MLATSGTTREADWLTARVRGGGGGQALLRLAKEADEGLPGGGGGGCHVVEADLYVRGRGL